jgi:hypothetical protein
VPLTPTACARNTAANASVAPHTILNITSFWRGLVSMTLCRATVKTATGGTQAIAPFVWCFLLPKNPQLIPSNFNITYYFIY